MDRSFLIFFHAIMESNKPKVSVIVPVYNVKAYLEQCLDSILKQSIKDIEIIVIDDGSTDGSGQVCDSYAQRDFRIRVIHKANQGISVARNDGLDIAQAEYVMFLDSDDWVEPEFCEIPYNIAEKTGSEMVVFRRVWHREKDVKAQAEFPSEGIISKKEILTDLWSLVGVISWNKLYKREVFNDIHFPVGRLSEDVAVTHRVIQKANSVYLINDCLYHHRCERPRSIMWERSEKQIADEAVLNMLRYRDLKEWGYISETEEVKQALFYLIKMGKDAELSDYCKEIIDGNSIAGDASWKMRVMYRMYRFSPGIFDIVSALIRTRGRAR